MQHEHHRVPVTALAFFEGCLLSGEGTYLKVYSRESELLKAVHIFERQAIHGITIEENGPISTALVWGGPLIRPLFLASEDDGEIHVTAGSVLNAADWILDVAFPSSIGSLAAIVTAHNALSTVEVQDPPISVPPSAQCRDTTPKEVLELQQRPQNNSSVKWHPEIVTQTTKPSRRCSSNAALQLVVPGSNCILYSAHLTWLSPSRCLIVSGTAFGDIIVWSANLRVDNKYYTAQSQTHYTFSAHEGSVFGVQISPQLTVPGFSCERVLASCSDDRTIRLWDISGLSTVSSDLEGKQRDTGFGSRMESETHAPLCLAKAMGHISRIWHVRFSDHYASDGSLRMWSFGEDASVVTWNIRAKEDRYLLQKLNTQTAHSGKNIWSVATDAELLATGAADGAIALHSRTDQGHDITELPRSLYLESGGNDNFRAFGFVSPTALISTTDHGRVVLIDLPDRGGAITVKEVSPSLPGLIGYSLVASVPPHAFLGGTDGTIYSYAYPAGRFCELGRIQGKVAGLFACKGTSTAHAVLATSVGGVSAKLFLLERGTDEGVKACTSKSFTLDLPAGFVATSFSSHIGHPSHCAVLGSRQGSIAFYQYSSNNDDKPLRCSKLHTLAHGKEAVTALELRPGKTESGGGTSSWLFSTGRDGTFCVHAIRIFDDQIDLELVHQLSLPFGPNIEGFDVSDSGNLSVWGFKSKHFVVYDLNAQTETMSVECGGAHRNWTFQPSTAGTGRFVWTKASRLYQAASQTGHCLINSGGHGREIKAVAISSHPSQQVIATGAEDTNIKLFRIERAGFTCLQTLRKHNTGIQHLKWHESYLFSSGGFEEFFVWKVSRDIPYIGVGVFCESMHPRSGSSDLRVMGFDVMDPHGADPGFVIYMAYSDSTVKMWRYGYKTWELLAAGDYLTSCVTHVSRLGNGDGHALATAATDGHIALWTLKREEVLSWTQRQKVHQSTIHAAVVLQNIRDGTSIIITGGDDNAIGISRLDHASGRLCTLLVPRAHAAAVTGLAVISLREGAYWLASVSNDQRVKLWALGVDMTQPGVEGVTLRRLHDVFTAVADVSGLELCTLGDGALALLVCGVGMDLWRLPTDG